MYVGMYVCICVYIYIFICVCICTYRQKLIHYCRYLYYNCTFEDYL